MTRLTQDPARPSGPAGVHPAGRTHQARSRRTSLTGRAVILAVVLGVLVVTLALPVREWFAQRAEISGLAESVAAAEQRVAALEDQRARWDDPAYVETQARQRLQFVMPGEVGYVVVEDANDTGGDPPVDPNQPSTDPWYARLWGSVRAADEPPADR